MAEEQGDKNDQISDSDKKMDALMDMMKDACAKMDEGGKRMDARMDAFEEKQSRMDARMDSFRKDEDEDEDKKKEKAEADARKDAAKKDEDEDEDKKKAEADARKDAEEVEAKEKAEADARKDAAKKDAAKKDAAKKDEDEDEAHADAAPISKAEAAALRSQIAALEARAPAILSTADRERFGATQEAAEPAFQAFNDHAPAPLDGETLTQYKRRLGSKLQVNSPRWKATRLSGISDDGALDNILNEVFADSMAAAARGVDVPMGQLRAIERHQGGHTIIEYMGDTPAWMNRFAGNNQRGSGDWKKPH